MRRRRGWWLVSALLYLLALAALYYWATHPPLHQGMTVAEVGGVAGPTVGGAQCRGELLMVFERGSEWAGYRETHAYFRVDDGGQDQGLFNWYTGVAPPHWLRRFVYIGSPCQ